VLFCPASLDCTTGRKPRVGLGHREDNQFIKNWAWALPNAADYLGERFDYERDRRYGSPQLEV
jgi:hypothetical protein